MVLRHFPSQHFLSHAIRCVIQKAITIHASSAIIELKTLKKRTVLWAYLNLEKTVGGNCIQYQFEQQTAFSFCFLKIKIQFIFFTKKHKFNESSFFFFFTAEPSLHI